MYINYTAAPQSQLEITRVFNIDENIWRFGNMKLEDDYDYAKAKQSYLPEAFEDPRKMRRPGGGFRGGFGGDRGDRGGFGGDRGGFGGRGREDTRGIPGIEGDEIDLEDTES